MPPKGMSEKWIELTPAQAQEHDMPHVRGTIITDNGDGWVINEPGNRHLSGSIIQHRRRHTDKGTITYSEFVPVDNVLPQTERVLGNIAAETERLQGTVDDAGRHVPGEIDNLSRQRILLSNWLTITPEEEQEIKDYFAGVAGSRQRATNPFNKSIGERAVKMKNLKDRLGRDNPSAMRAMSHPLEADMTQRYAQVGRTRSRNTRRELQWSQWSREENQNIHHAVEAIEINDLDWLSRIGRGVRFRVQPFNELAGEIHSTGDRLVDPEQLARLGRGLNFMLFKNYLLKPFNELAKLKTKDFKSFSEDFERVVSGVNERQAALEEMDLDGPYHTLRGRILRLGGELLTAAQNGEATLAKQKDDQIKTLLAYHCEPKDDPAVNEWYGQKLSYIRAA